MENQYKILKEKHQKEVNELPFMFAFDEQQFIKGMEKLGLKEGETDKITYLGEGVYLKKVDLPMVEEVYARHQKEIEENIKSDKEGNSFIKDMFLYEMNNHEYGYTQEIGTVLDVLNISEYDLRTKENLRNGLMLAKQVYEERDKEQEELEEELEK